MFIVLEAIVYLTILFLRCRPKAQATKTYYSKKSKSKDPKSASSYNNMAELAKIKGEKKKRS